MAHRTYSMDTTVEVTDYFQGGDHARTAAELRAQQQGDDTEGCPCNIDNCDSCTLSCGDDSQLNVSKKTQTTKNAKANRTKASGL